MHGHERSDFLCHFIGVLLVIATINYRHLNECDLATIGQRFDESALHALEARAPHERQRERVFSGGPDNTIAMNSGMRLDNDFDFAVAAHSACLPAESAVTRLSLQDGTDRAGDLEIEIDEIVFVRQGLLKGGTEHTETAFLNASAAKQLWHFQEWPPCPPCLRG